MRRLRGFTLIEIAVVLFIGALLISGVVQYLTTQITAAKIAATHAKQDAIKTALTIFISRNNRLPCPAIATIANGGANYGVEAPTPGTCTGTVVNGAVSTGMVPWSSLGLASEASIDGYSNRFTYQVVLAATNLGAQTVAGMNGAITIHNAGPALVLNQTNNCSAGAPTNPCAAVVVIVSHGSDGYGAYNDAGVQVAVPAPLVNGDEWENTNADNKFVVKPFSGASATPYDDIVMALTPGELLAPLTTGGALQDFRAALNANFNIIKNAIMVKAINANPSGPPYTYTLDANTNNVYTGIPIPIPSVQVDPWNQPYRYSTTLPLRQIVAGGALPTAPTTAAFTLTSNGPDGTFGNADDVSMIVYVGEFQALAAKFR